MLRYLLSFLFIFLMLSTLAIAKKSNIEAVLHNEYGADLTHAPFFLRYSFHKQYKKDWKDSTYSQRRDFLANYESNIDAEQAQEKADAKAESRNEKDRLRQQRQAERDARESLRAQAAAEKAEQKEGRDRQKDFNSMLKDQQKELQQMQKDTTQGN